MRRTRPLFFSVATLCMFLGLFSTVSAQEIPKDLVPALIQSMKDEMSASYHVKTEDKGRFIADNPIQQLRFGFTDRGIEVIAGEKTSWHMQFQGYSFEGKYVPLKAVMPESIGARVEYKREGMTEWYINSPYGMEQGFTFESPENPGNSKLVLNIALEGDIVQQGNSLVYRSEDGDQIRYKGLQVFDAEDRLLASNLALQGKQLLIEVDVTDAEYPVTVDPVFTSETRLNASDGAAEDRFGSHVAISGNTAVAGAGLDDDNGIDSGSAYIFVKSGDTWSEQQKLTASDGAAGDYFG